MLVRGDRGRGQESENKRFDGRWEHVVGGSVEMMETRRMAEWPVQQPAARQADAPSVSRTSSLIGFRVLPGYGNALPLRSYGTV